jgi:YidC/Oxa1 family membrane protein insertase
MEHARLLLALVLSFLVFFLWEFFFVDREAMQPPPPTTEPPADVADAPQPPPVTRTDPIPEPAVTPIPEPTVPVEPASTFRTLTVENDRYRVRLSEAGAVLTSFVLKDYRESAEKTAPPKELIGETVSGGSLRLETAEGGIPGLESAHFTADPATDHIVLDDTPKTVRLTWQSSGGITVEKAYTFSPGTYLVDLTVRIYNGSDRPLTDRIAFVLAGKLQADPSHYAFEGPSALLDQSLEQIKVKNIPKHRRTEGLIRWIAIEKQYFLTALLPAQPEVEGVMRLGQTEDGVITNTYVAPRQPVAPGGTGRYEVDLYFGPKSLKVLNDLDNNLARIINFGWFDIISKPCLWLMNFLYRFIPNYGVAIIILTIFIKLILWPLGNKGYQSMNEMKKLQPEMARIREKYKDDKKRMNEELMALYRTYKVNPLGGCLPMVLQIPVFIALYRMLYEAIELRHAPFVGWINDLSSPDRLFHFNVDYIPLMQPPYGIPVLTVIMGATMFLQQKMSPPPGDPTQAKMMTFLPIVFTFIFINFPSGLVLYWLVNNVLSIAQQAYIAKKKS